MHTQMRSLACVHILEACLSRFFTFSRKAPTQVPCRTPFPLRHCTNIVLVMEWNKAPSSPAQLPVLYHSSSMQRAPSKHPALQASPVQRTIFSCSTAILEFVADWLLLGVWAVSSSGMSGLLSNHSRIPGQGGWLEALITALSLLKLQQEHFSLFYN